MFLQLSGGYIFFLEADPLSDIFWSYNNGLLVIGFYIGVGIGDVAVTQREIFGQVVVPVDIYGYLSSRVE